MQTLISFSLFGQDPKQEAETYESLCCYELWNCYASNLVHF